MSLRRWVVVTSPLLLIVLAMLGLFADLRIEDAADGTGSPLTAPLQFGVYVSPESEKALDSLLGGAASAGAPSWQLQIEPDHSGLLGGAADAGAEISFGPLQSSFPSYTTIGESEDTVDGSLPKPVDIVFTLPDGSLDGPSQTCAEWTAAGTEHTVAGTALPGGNGYPDVLTCHIPAIPAFTALKISASGSAPALSLARSWVGTSTVSVTNPRILAVTAAQDGAGAIPENLMHSTGQQYDLYLRPPHGSKFTDIEPGPTGVGLLTRQIPVSPGGSVAASMVDTRRHTIIDVVQQALLLLSGTLFGLVPAVLPFAAKARRGEPGKAEDD